MKDIVKLGLTLMVITVLAAAGLAAVYSVTKPRIDAQRQMETERALTVALPQADPESIQAVKDGEEVRYYQLVDDDSQVVAYAFVARGTGYSSVIETMVGVDTSGRVIGMKVLSQTETPGLGTKVEEIRYGETDPWFQRQFIDKPAGDLAVKADGGEIVSITGATISSRALANSVIGGYKKLIKEIQSDSSGLALKSEAQ
ncbi:RnfABCDGE type electron transport complex subunit G [candidate division KSB1 bacterium]|nr:RnfABCDGE type electron transport complex subunit G [candidate division KSB1 bacterium]